MLEAVKQWAFTLVITAVVGGLANSFTISENGGMKKYIKFACAAVALAVMIMPIREMFKEMPGLFDFYEVNINSPAESEIYDNDINDTYDINVLAAAKINELLKERISDIVYEKTGIKPADVDIYIKQKDNSEIEVEKIEIDMPENFNGAKIEEAKLYLKQLFNCETVISDISDGGAGDKIND